MYILQLDPWKFWFFSNKVPGGSSQNRGGLARRFPARGSPAARARWGRSERRSCSTDLRVLVATRMTGGEGSAVGAAGGASAPARRRSGDAGARRPGLGASGGHGEGCGVVHLDQSQAEEAVDDELELAGVIERSGGGFCARGGRPRLL